MIGIVRGTRVIARNGRNVDAFEPGGSIKSASKPHGSIFSDRLDDINCHFLLDTRPILANFNCPRISAFRRTIDHHRSFDPPFSTYSSTIVGKFNLSGNEIYIFLLERKKSLAAVLLLGVGARTVFSSPHLVRYTFFRASVSLFQTRTRLLTKQVNEVRTKYSLH